MNEYIIVNQTVIEKRIEELAKEYVKRAEVKDNQWCSIIAGQILSFKQLLSQSTPLIPELEKAYISGEKYGIAYSQESETDDMEFDYYISNLKLNV